jgi:hypothetical protein
LNEIATDVKKDGETISVLFINQLGGGFPEQCNILPGTTLSEFLDAHTDKAPEDLLIRVRQRGSSSQAEPSDYEIQPNDRISATIIKQEGGIITDMLTALILLAG